MPEVTRVQELVFEVKIEEVMTRNVVTVTSETTMAELREILRDHRISGTPVVDDQGRMVGIISIEDLIEALAAQEMDATVQEKMVTNPIALRAEESVAAAIDHFASYRFGRFPVINAVGDLVGIITRGDIIQGLLSKLEIEYHDEEIRHYRASHLFEDVVSDRTSVMLRYNVPLLDFDLAGEASSNIKLVLTRLGTDPQIIRRAAIVAYEAETNLIIHTSAGGEISVEVQPRQVIIRAIDQGPGIEDVSRVLQPGFSTAPEWIRELGFGAGMGLSNIRRCSDEMRFDSALGVGTTLESVIYLNRKDGR